MTSADIPGTGQVGPDVPKVLTHKAFVHDAEKSHWLCIRLECLS